MRSIPSRIVKCGLWALLAWAGFAGSLGQPSAAGADKDDLTEAEQAALKDALYRLPDLRTLDESEIKQKVLEAARKGGLLNFGPHVDYERSVPRIGYRVYSALLMEGDHYYQGKLIRADDLGLFRSYTPDMKAALTKKYGKPEPGPKFEWMKLKFQVGVEEQCHWNFKATITQEGKPIEIKVACELTFRKNGNPMVSLIDTERAEAVGKALGGKAAVGGAGKPLDLGMPLYPPGPLQRILRRLSGISPPFPICR